MSKKFLAHAGLLTANIIYGANYSIAKDVMENYLNPFGFILVRVFFATLLFFVTAPMIVNEKLSRQDIPRVLFCALTGIAINQLLFFKGLSLTVPINASIMMVCTPIIVLIIGIIFHEEPFGITRLIGIVTGFLGAFYLIYQPGVVLNKFSSGDLMVLINACSWGIYLVLVKPLMQKYHTITVIKWVFFCGLFMVLPFGFNDIVYASWSQMPVRIIWEIVFVVIATTFIAYILNTYALKSLDASVVGTYVYLQPLLAAFFAVLSGKDEPDTRKVIACLIVFAGVYLTTYNPRRELKN